jgi:transcriptional regulator with XRE-family HTH domain
MDVADFKRSFGQRIQHFRRRREMTQEELADRVERSPETISNIERGNSSTRIETAVRIAQALDVAVVELFDVEITADLDHERREAVELLVDLVKGESQEFLTMAISQIKLLLAVKGAAPNDVQK